MPSWCGGYLENDPTYRSISVMAKEGLVAATYGDGNTARQLAARASTMLDRNYSAFEFARIWRGSIFQVMEDT